MRRTAWLGMALTAFLCGAPVRGEEPRVLYSATIQVNDAEVRSGAGTSTQLYATNRLRKGDKVEVVKEVEGGWIGIKPPTGSFSWIKSTFVRRIGNTEHFVVVAHPDTKVPLLLGSSIRAEKPTVEGAKVLRGTQLRSIGPQRLADDGYWLPVEPPPTEVRYIRAEATRKPAETVAGASPPDAGGSPSPTPPSSEPPGQGGPNALWQRAQQFEQAGQYHEAIRVYQQLGAEVATTNKPLSEQAYHKAQGLTDALAGRPPSRVPNATPPGQGGTPPTATPGGMVASGPGWLRRAGRTLDYNTLYVLENSQGLPIVYATAQSGYSLDSYTNQNVELMGPRQFRNDLRAYHMTVMQVRPLR